jgi:iron complex outermembrane receptor protein
VPSISFGNDFNFAKLFIRGIGLNSSFPGADPSVALHVDGAVIAQAGAQMSAMFDLERIEVLRGPQGTLYGRNATGGAINLITAKPSAALDGYARFTLGGSDVNTLAEGAVGGPLSNSLRARLAVRYLNRDGYGVNEITGSDIDNARQFSTRLSVQYLVGEAFDLLLSAELHLEDDRSNALKFRAASFPNATAPLPGQVDLRSLATLPGYAVAADATSGERRPGQRSPDLGAHRDGDWQVSDALALKSLTNYRDYEAEFCRTSTCRSIPVAVSRWSGRRPRARCRPAFRAPPAITGSRCISTSGPRNCSWPMKGTACTGCWPPITCRSSSASRTTWATTRIRTSAAIRPTSGRSSTAT